MRIALGGIATECCTFSPLLTKAFQVKRGQEMLHASAYPFIATAKDTPQLTLLPTLQARTIPGGCVARATYDALKAEYLERLAAALPLDGVYLDMHGAMNVEGLDDAEGNWYQSTRELVGPECLISASYDLHGNISPRIIAMLDMLSAYRTAPHVDVLATRNKAFSMLRYCLETAQRPKMLWVPIPVILPGECTSTEHEPAATIYQRLTSSDTLAGVLDISLLVGYVWADEPRSGASVVATGFDRDVLKDAALHHAQAYWDMRSQFTFGVPSGTIAQALQWAHEHPERGLIVSDSGDNPTAGGVSDSALCLKEVLTSPLDKVLIAGITDAQAHTQCSASGEGSQITLAVGASLAPTISERIIISGKVKKVTDTQAVVQVGSHCVIITAQRTPFHDETDFTSLGLHPHQFKLTVVKIGYLVPDLRRLARGTFLALSPGAVDQNIPRLGFQRAQRPIYPLDPHMQWQPQLENYPPHLYADAGG